MNLKSKMETKTQKFIFLQSKKIEIVKSNNDFVNDLRTQIIEVPKIQKPLQRIFYEDSYSGELYAFWQAVILNQIGILKEDPVQIFKKENISEDFAEMFLNLNEKLKSENRKIILVFNELNDFDNTKENAYFISPLVAFFYSKFKLYSNISGFLAINKTTFGYLVLEDKVKYQNFVA